MEIIAFHENDRNLVGFPFWREKSLSQSLIFDKEYLCFRVLGAEMCVLPPKHGNSVNFGEI